MDSQYFDFKNDHDIAGEFDISDDEFDRLWSLSSSLDMFHYQWANRNWWTDKTNQWFQDNIKPASDGSGFDGQFEGLMMMDCGHHEFASHETISGNPLVIEYPADFA